MERTKGPWNVPHWTVRGALDRPALERLRVAPGACRNPHLHSQGSLALAVHGLRASEALLKYHH